MSAITLLQLTLAGLFGVAIGFERQWNQGMAGLRTNALVAFGAASFVSIGRLVAGDDRVAAQIVSGIGFLGAGVIFREGPSVRGLNTAATIWCSGACGALCGAGFIAEAGYCAAGVVAINLGLRRLKEAIDRWSPHPADIETDYQIEVRCAGAEEANVRSLLLGGSFQGGLGLKSLHSEKIDGQAGAVRIVAEIAARSRSDKAVEEIIGRLGLEEGVTSARWHIDAPGGERAED